jgi:hypothetical protein
MKQTLFAFFFSAALATAQSTTGALVGTVSDATGAVITRTKIRVVNEATGITLETSTNAAGE